MTSSLASLVNSNLRLAAVIALLLFATATASLRAQPPAPPQVDHDARAAIIEDILGALHEVYIFLDVAEEMGESLRANLASGAYDELSVLPDFCQQLTDDLRAVSHDLHLRVSYAPPPPPSAGGERPSEEEMRQRNLRAARRNNFCFRKVEHLAGNVGYLKFDCFMEANIGGPTAVAALRFLANSDALIIDLRDNGGGSPSMIQLMSSYFFAEPIHLNSFYVRETDETRQFWTQSWVDGERMVDVPIFVLTSGNTFSAAEEFTYNLKNMERATIVGQTTGGGAHPVRTHEVEGYPVRMSLPFGRAINPITGTNWEGTGIAPHLEVVVDEAPARAHVEALKVLEKAATDDQSRAALAFSRLEVETLGNPVELSAQQLRAFVGTYGPRKITLQEGALHYSRDGRPSRPMIAGGEDRFFIEGVSNFYLRFERDDSGSVVRITGNTPGGIQDQHERSQG